MSRERRSIWSWLTQLPSLLNWFLSVIEPLLVLVIAVVILYVIRCLLFGPNKVDQQVRFKELLEIINSNWKAGVLLLIVLFYRTVRTFLEQAEEAFSVKRKIPLKGDPQEGPTPLKGDASSPPEKI